MKVMVTSVPCSNTSDVTSLRGDNVYLKKKERALRSDINIVAIWQREEDRERRSREEDPREISEAEQIHKENIKKIMEQAKKNLDTPPDPPSVKGSPAVSTGKISDVATFVTDLLQKYSVKE